MTDVPKMCYSSIHLSPVSRRKLMKPSMTIETQLIEMIAPRVDDIKTRFGNGEALQPDDINTLLLHSQYNHIQHLDQRLDEVADSVTALRGDFVGLKNDFALLQKDFASLKKRDSDRNPNRAEP